MIRFWKSEREFLVLPVEADDHERIAEIHGQGFERGWSVAEIDGLARHDGTRILVAREVGGGKKPIAGFCIYRTSGSESEILSIAVDPGVRRAGIGGQLMRESIRQLQAERTQELFLEVEELNLPAVTMYRRLGFQDVGVRPGYYRTGGPGVEAPKTTALVMRLELG